VTVSGGGNKTGRSWADAFDSIGKALEAAKRGDEIWVQQGTYRESVILKEGVVLLGGFLGGEGSSEERDWLTNITMIDASGKATSTVIGAAEARIDGFTITGGSAENGGGIYCDDASPIIRNCNIKGNYASSDGGGIYFHSTDMKIENCRIEDNHAEYGGGIYMYDARAFFSDCCFLENVATYNGGGVCTYRNGVLELNKCKIQANRAGSYGGGLNLGMYGGTIRSSLIVANTCGYGGSGINASRGTLYWYGYVDIINCVFTENSGRNAFNVDNGMITSIVNSIFWGKTLQSIHTGAGEDSYFTIFNCDIMEEEWEDWETDGNLSEDPKFVYPWDGQWGDFRLQEDSPCIDAGMSDYPSLDLYQPPGLGGRRNDMGAFGGITNNVTFTGFPFDSGSPAPTPTPTITPTTTPSASPTETPTPTIYWTPTPSPSETPIPTPTPAGPRLWILHGNGKVYSLPGGDD